MNVRALGSLALAFSMTAAISTTSLSSWAQSDEDRATARILGQEGQDALDRKDFKAAEERFGRAEKLFHAPTLLLGLARSYAGQGKLVAAHETYSRMIREGLPPQAPAAFVRALEEAKREAEQIGPKIGSVTIHVAAAGGGDVANPKVSLDDRPVNAASLGVRRPVDPGAHVVKVTADGFRAGEARFNVAEGGNATTTVTLEKEGAVAAVPPAVVPAATTPSTTSTSQPVEIDRGSTNVAVSSGSSRKTMALVAFGVGGAGLIAGSVAGVLALGKKSDLDEKCPTGTCNRNVPGVQDDIDSYRQMGLISTIGFVVAGVGAATGIVLLVTAPKEPSNTATVSPYLGLGTFGAMGQF